MRTNGHPYDNAETYPIRTAQIGAVCIINASSAAAVQFGDRGETNAKLCALAVQRKESHTTAGDVFFESYRIFDRRLPSLIDPDFDKGQVVTVNRVNYRPFITVGCVNITAAGSASSFLAGNCMSVNSESRIKHIRQYPRPRPVPAAIQPQCDK